MRHTVIIFFYGLFFAFSQQSNAQQSNLQFNHLNSKKGLSQGVNNCVYKDSRGFIWISSFDGLNRFDGMDCTVFRADEKNSGSIKGTLFLNILEDKNGNLWIGSNEGINCYVRNKNRFQNFQISETIHTDKIYSPFYIDDQNNVWLQSGGEIWLFNTINHQFKKQLHFETTHNILVKSWVDQPFLPLQKMLIAIKDESTLYTALLKKNEWELSKIPFDKIHPDAFIKCILPDRNSCWIGTQKGLFVYRNNSIQPITNTVNPGSIPEITCLNLDANNQLWIGTFADGLYQCDVEKLQLKLQYKTSALNNYSLSGNQVQYLLNDDQETLWAAVWGKGIDYVNLDNFNFGRYVTIDDANKFNAENFIRPIIVADSNTIICGTQQSGILVLNNHKKIVRKVNDGLPKAIEHLCKDQQGNIWVATLNGLFVTDKWMIRKQRIPNNANKNQLADQYNFLLNLQDGRMMASTNSGMYFVERKTGQYFFKPVKGLSMQDVYLTSFQSLNGDLYISRPFKGFAIYHLQNDSLILKKEIFSKSTIKCFNETADSILWIGSTIGLMRFNNELLSVSKIITSKDGLSNQYIYGILRFKNQLWLSSNNGISCLQLPAYSIKNYSEADGLQANEFNTYAYTAFGNEFLFGGVNGLNAFNPAAIKSNNFQPSIQLNKLFINDRSVSDTIATGEIKQLQLNHFENTVSFQFAVLNYINPEASKLLYQLEGYDDSTWIETGNKALIRYANLPAGHFLLKVKIAGNTNSNKSLIFKLPIEIKNAWYHSIWFYAGMLLLGIGFIFLGVRTFFKNKLRKQLTLLEKQQAIEKERTRIATDMHDDFGASLSRIKFLSEKMQLQQAEKEQLKTGLEKISLYSDEMAEKMGEIVWALNKRYDSIADLMSFCRSYASEYLADKNISLQFNEMDAGEMIFINGEIRRNIFLVMKEALHNIVKHSGATTVTISINCNKNLEMMIADNGKGFDENNIRQFANGINNMKKRTEDAGGIFNIQNQQGVVITVLYQAAILQNSY